MKHPNEWESYGVSVSFEGEPNNMFVIGYTNVTGLTEEEMIEDIKSRLKIEFTKLEQPSAQLFDTKLKDK